MRGLFFANFWVVALATDSPDAGWYTKGTLQGMLNRYFAKEIALEKAAAKANKAAAAVSDAVTTRQSRYENPDF